MKPFLSIFVLLVILSVKPYCQCPAPGLSIQSAACEEPKNLKSHFITCSELGITWTGNKDQTYDVKATCREAATNTIELQTSKSYCDSFGNCRGTVSVREGCDVSWSVRSVCTIENASFYSAEVEGPDVYIPHCQEKMKGTDTKTQLKIYPNPSPGYLVIEYAGKVDGMIEFRIFDVTGKQVLTKVESAPPTANIPYKLDVYSLPPGTYMIEAHFGNEVTCKSKFVLLKNNKLLHKELY